MVKNNVLITGIMNSNHIQVNKVFWLVKKRLAACMNVQLFTRVPPKFTVQSRILVVFTVNLKKNGNRNLKNGWKC